eukprot:SAG22_NODE_3777_length_1532_cov_1.634589_1_plen_228_part_10
MLGGDSDKILPFFVLTALPQGFAGALMAAVLGSTMSVFCGGINSASACFVYDVLGNGFGVRLQPERIVLVTREFTLVFSALCIIFAFFAAQLGGIIRLCNSVMGLTMGPIFGIFCLGICNDRANAQGAKVAIVVAAMLCAYLQICESYCPTGCTADTPVFFSAGSMSPFWFICITSAATVLVGSFASLCFDSPGAASIQGLTWRKRGMALVEKNEAHEPLVRPGAVN